MVCGVGTAWSGRVERVSGRRAIEEAGRTIGGREGGIFRVGSGEEKM